MNVATSRACFLARASLVSPTVVDLSLAALLVWGGVVKGHLDTAEVPLLNSNGPSAGAGWGKGMER